MALTVMGGSHNPMEDITVDTVRYADHQTGNRYRIVTVTDNETGTPTTVRAYYGETESSLMGTRTAPFNLIGVKRTMIRIIKEHNRHNIPR